MARRDTTAHLHNHAAFVIEYVEGGNIAAQAFRHQLDRNFLTLDEKGIGVEESIEDFFTRIFQGPQNNRRWEFATTVDADEYAIFRVKLKVEP